MLPTYRPRHRLVKPGRLGAAPLVLGMILLIAGGAGPRAAAVGQGLPAFGPINPVAASRSGLLSEPYRSVRPGAWTFSTGVDYASTIESNTLPDADYLLDSELLRIRLGLVRDFSARAFLLLDGEVAGAYDGFLDGFLNWYHARLGIDVPEREERPNNDFGYRVSLADGTEARRREGALFFGDLRLGLGVRINPVLQSVVAVTLPTSTGPPGYGREVVSVNLLNTVRAKATPRLVYEGSLSAGYTPTRGPLAARQREVMVAASSGLRLRFWGRQSLFANLFYHSPYYEGTSLPSLDRRELSLDFGWILATEGGTEWRIGMAEDLEPGGPAVDLVFRLGTTF